MAQQRSRAPTPATRAHARAPPHPRYNTARDAGTRGEEEEEEGEKGFLRQRRNPTTGSPGPPRDSRARRAVRRAPAITGARRISNGSSGLPRRRVRSARVRRAGRAGWLRVARAVASRWLARDSAHPGEGIRRTLPMRMGMRIVLVLVVVRSLV